MIDMNIARDLLRKAEDLKGYKCVLHRDGCFLMHTKTKKRVRLGMRLNRKTDNVEIRLNGKLISRESEEAFYNQSLKVLEI